MKPPSASPVAISLALAWVAALPARSAEPEKAPSFPPPRAELVARHDRNGDGRLDAAEREAMRLALRDERLKTRRAGFQIPPDFLAKYDANRDGEMAGEEWKVAWDAETKILRETYDADHDGELSKDEKKSMMGDVARGKITGIPAFFAGRMTQDPRASGPEYLDGPRAWLKFDANGNGRADPEELRKLRKSRPNQP